MYKIRNSDGEMATDRENIQGIIQDLFTPFYTVKSVSLNEMNYFIENYKLPKPTSKKIEKVREQLA